MPKGLENPLLREPIEFEIALDNINVILKDTCSTCGGSGLRPAMQLMAVIGGGSLRGPNTLDKCDICKGTGRR